MITVTGDVLKAIKHSTGVRLAYRDEGSGPPILLVHGWGVSGGLFAPQWEELASRFRLIVPDMPGHGSSGEFPQGSDFELLADCLAELIVELRLQSLCLVGWSMGAMVSWDLLRRYPKLDISGLVTVDMVPRLLNGPDWSYGLRYGEDHHVFDRHLSLMRSNWPAFTDLFMARIFAPGDSAKTRDLLRSAKQIALQNHPESMARIWSQMVEQDFNAQMQDITLPALVLSGKKSRLYSTQATEWVACKMPNATHIEFEQSGHAPNLEEPEKFNQLLSEFVDSINTGPAQAFIRPVTTGAQS